MTSGGVRRLVIARVPEDRARDALAAAARLPLLEAGGGGPAAPETTVAFVASEVALHVLFEAAAEPPLRVAAGGGGPVYEDECVELFVARAGDPAAYREIVVNPAGARYGAEVRNPDDSRATWTLLPGRLPEGLSVAVTGEPAGAPPGTFRRWSCRLAVPWSSLSPGGRPPAPGEIRRLNAYRIARGATASFQALSPTLRAAPPDFHVPSRFAEAVFSA
ncbi:MAG TPA: carbohydrate-binding family 9-like protein [Thermoanaerobaculia bacterium]|nr:carbohydrate-binding family 9-like protein [Thermoanaerobaculia bacterium]